MSNFDEAKTQFIRDRIKETAFHERQYIHHLLWLEDIIFRGGPTQWAEGMAYGGLRKDYPLEAEAIRRELREGKRTTPEEFKALQEERTRKLAMDEEEWRLSLDARESDELQEWLKAGGLPDGAIRRDSSEQ
ncbi:MAG: hypothetical protein FJ012_11025 [Chloroflexi bacterium]|nr:hypothetical protein [Chloroflexota bacterium]